MTEHRLYEQTSVSTTSKLPATTQFIPSEPSTITSTLPSTTKTTTTTSSTTISTSTTIATTTTTTTTTTIKITDKINTTTMTSTDTIQKSSSSQILSEYQIQSIENDSENYSDESHYSDLESTSTTQNAESFQSEESSEEVDTTAEIILSKNPKLNAQLNELKPYTESLVATTNVEYLEKHSSNLTSDKNYLFTSTSEPIYNVNDENDNDEYYQDELMLVTSSPDKTSKSFLTSLLDSALSHFNKTTYENIEPSLASSTQIYAINTTAPDNYTHESEEYEDSYESDDTINDSEFLELLKLIGTTTPNIGKNQNDEEMTNLNSTTIIYDYENFENLTEKISNSTNVSLNNSFEYFTTQKFDYHFVNESVIPTTTHELSTSDELMGSQDLQDLTPENMTKEEPIETESTLADFFQASQSTYDLTRVTNNPTTESMIKTTAKLVEEEPADLCNDPIVDAITRTEWGNALVFKGDYIWHIRGLTKWRLFDYEGWPKKITQLFPGLPGNIDSAYLYDDLYHFTKVIYKIT